MSTFAELSAVIEAAARTAGTDLARTQLAARSAGTPLASDDIIGLANLQVDLTLSRALPALRGLMLEAVLQACSARTDEIIASLGTAPPKSH